MQVIKELKMLFKGISVHAPMRVVEFQVFKEFGKLPRSSDKKTVDLSAVPGYVKLVFISHHWLLPHKDPKIAHPDDAAGSKHALICAGIEKLAENFEKKDWSIERVYLWLDFCCVEQDDPDLLREGVALLRGYTICDAVLIPSPEVSAEEDERKKGTPFLMAMHEQFLEA